MKTIRLGFAIFIAALVAMLPTGSVLAQDDDGTRTLIFDGHQLDFPAALTNGVQIALLEAGAETDTNVPQAARLRFLFVDYELASMPLGTVDIYRLDELSGYPAEQQFAELAALLEERPDLDTYLAEHRVLPTTHTYLDMSVGSFTVNTFATRAAYLETADYSGVVFIHARQYDVSSFIAFTRYQFEAISADGKWGVSARFDLRPAFPDSFDDDRPADFSESAARTEQFLADAPADAFAPSLGSLDALFESISFTE